MDVRFDATAGSFIVEPGGLAIDLDDRTGVAGLALPDGRIELRPMRWTEKVRLARHAGPAWTFPAARLVRIALDGGEAELAPSDLAVVLAVARWLNGLAEPPAALPLEPGVLATVTVELCGSLGLRPADLDERDALDVEALWTAIRATAATDVTVLPDFGGAPRTTAFGGDATRIMIVPDPAADGAAETRPTERGPVAGPFAAMEPSTGRIAAGGRPAVGPPPDGVPEPGRRLDVRSGSPPGAPGPRYRLVDPATMLSDGTRRAVAPASSESAETSSAAEPPATSPPDTPTPARAEPAPVADRAVRRPSRSGGPEWSMTVPRGEVGPGWTGDGGPPQTRALIDPAAVLATQQPLAGDTDDGWGQTRAAPAARRSSPSLDRSADELIEDFGERFERAAAQLGIGP